MPYEPLTDEELAVIQARTEAATPGPWESEMGNVYSDSPEGDARLDYMAVAYDIPREDNDGPFIAHARTDIPRLLATVEMLMRLGTMAARVFEGGRGSRIIIHGEDIDEVRAAVAQLGEVD